MIILPQHEKEDRVIAAVTMQLLGWVFESHCWELDDENNELGPRTCRWCGATSLTDLIPRLGGQVDLCLKNPAVEQLLEEGTSASESTARRVIDGMLKMKTSEPN